LESSEVSQEKRSSNPKIIIGKVVVGPVTNNTVDDTRTKSIGGVNASAGSQTRHSLPGRSEVNTVNQEQGNVPRSIMAYYREKIAELTHSLENSMHQVKYCRKASVNL
jgi:hypothetical protein